MSTIGSGRSRSGRATACSRVDQVDGEPVEPGGAGVSGDTDGGERVVAVVNDGVIDHEGQMIASGGLRDRLQFRQRFLHGERAGVEQVDVAAVARTPKADEESGAAFQHPGTVRVGEETSEELLEQKLAAQLQHRPPPFPGGLFDAVPDSAPKRR